jgi:hypothetical protein
MTCAYIPENLNDALAGRVSRRAIISITETVLSYRNSAKPSLA